MAELESVGDILGSVTFDGDLLQCLEKINTARTKMLSVDYNLRDNVAIINGYSEVSDSVSKEEKMAGEIYER
jgi:hypothetical protein